MVRVDSVNLLTMTSGYISTISNKYILIIKTLFIINCFLDITDEIYDRFFD
jgi:hypothetical protein